MSDWAEVRRFVAAGARATYADLRAQNPGEQFYAFALYDCDDATGPQVSANSEQKFQELLARHRPSYEKQGRPFGPRQEAVYRWGTAEWWYEAEGGEHFAPASALLEELSAAASERDAYPEFRAHAFAALTGALCELDREGVFGTGPERDRVTVFASLSDSRDAWWLREESARLANPPAVYEAFEREWLDPPPPAEDAPQGEWYDWRARQQRRLEAPGETYSLFMRLVGT